MMRVPLFVLIGAAACAFGQSPSPTPGNSLVDALSPADVEQAISALQANFIRHETITGVEMNRATLEGLLTRLGRGAVVLRAADAPSQSPEIPAYSDVLENHIGYLRIGSLTNANLQAVDKIVPTFASKKCDALILDLRVDAPMNDFAVAAEFAKRFVTKTTMLFKLRSAARAERAFANERDPLFQGTLMILVDDETAGGAEAIAGSLRSHGKALVIGETTAGRPVEYTSVAISGGKSLQVASSEVVLPDGKSLFPDGVKPDVAVDMSRVDKRQVFQASRDKGMAPFVYESERPHLNEAALISGTNPELDEGRRRAREAPAVRDPVTQRAVDIITSLAVYEKR